MVKAGRCNWMDRMEFPLIIQMDFSATYCLIPGFVISFLIGH